MDKSFFKVLTIVEAGLVVVFWMFADFFALFGHLTLSLIFFGLGICSALAVACHYSYKEWPAGAKAICVSYVVLFFITCGVLYTFSRPDNSNKSTRESFSFVCTGSEIGETNPPLYLLWQGVRGMYDLNAPTNLLMLSPIQIIIYAQLTEIGDQTVHVASFDFEGKSTDGHWTKLVYIDSHLGALVSHPPAGYFKIGMGKIFLDEMQSNDGLKAGDMVEGALFFEWPPDGFTGDIRIRLKDSSDREYISIMKNSLSLSFSGKRWDISLAPVGKDLTSVPIKGFSREMARASR